MRYLTLNFSNNEMAKCYCSLIKLRLVLINRLINGEATMANLNITARSLMSILALISPQCLNAAVDLPLLELSINTPVEPNILFVLDDSVSMRETITLSNFQYEADSYYYASESRLSSSHYKISKLSCENNYGAKISYQSWDPGFEVDLCGGGNPSAERPQFLKLAQLDWRLFNSHFDVTQYDPKRTYKPWTGYPDLDFHDAMFSPQFPDSTRFDLGTLQFSYTVWKDTAGWTPPLSQANLNLTPNGLVDIWDDFDQYYFDGDQVKITATTFAPTPKVTDCRPDMTLDIRSEVLRCFNGTETIVSTSWDNRWGRTLQEEQTNIANWFGYHRERQRTLAGLVGQIMEDHPSFRFGLTTFVSREEQLIPSAETYDKAVQNKAVLDVAIFNPSSQGTFTRRGLDRALEHFRDTNPATRPIIEACQQNFAFMISDGFETKTAGPDVEPGDFDGDGEQTTIADVAHYAYNTDLRPDLPDIVPPTPSACPGVPLVKNQHMRTIAIPFGFGSTIPVDAKGCWPESGLGEADVWGNPDGMTIEGLWHATYNSGGQFIPAVDVPYVLESVQKLLTTIDRGVKSGASGSITSGRLQSGNSYFTSQYELADLTGDIKSWPLRVDEQDIELGNPLWSAGELVNNNTFFDLNRLVFTYNPIRQQAVQLTPDANVNNTLTENQRNTIFPNLNGQALKSAFSDFATRLIDAPLATFIHSTPLAVVPPDRVFPEEMPQANAYLSFIQAQKNRPTTVYAGSNGGSLHGFDGDTGKELFAYVPDLVLDQSLRKDDIAIQSRVDGPMLAIDTYFNDADAWKTVLISGLGQGGKGYFALDVTDPRQFAVDEFNDKVLWEFNGDNDLGYTLAKPAVGLMANGRWVAVFGNGYNSSTGDAVLYFVDVETGNLIKKVKTGYDAAHDPQGLNRRNGLAEPALIDLDFDGIIDRIYVGDYFGNLFNIDVTNTDASQWSSAYGTTELATPLFSTGGQPITSKPGALFHPTDGLVVLVGTGQMFAKNQATGENAFYGLYDTGSPIANNSDLVHHEMSSSTTDIVINTGTDVADTKGWTIEFDGILAGSNITSAPKIQNGEVSFVAAKQTTEAICSEATFYSSILTVNAISGRSLEAPVFLDENGNSIRRNNKNVDGIVSNSKYLDAVVIGNGSKEVFLTTTSNGEQILINKASSVKTRRQTYWMRLAR